MAVDNPGVIDAIGIARDAVVELTVSDHLEWDEANEHLLFLQEKLNTYLAFVEGGELLEAHPKAGAAIRPAGLLNAACRRYRTNQSRRSEPVSPRPAHSPMNARKPPAIPAGARAGEPAMAHAATTHVRVNRSLLAQVERHTLLWLAHRLPARMHSDHLTALAVVGTAIASLSFALARLFPVALVGVVAGLALNWFGDSLDGTLARVRRQERPRYGYYVDHVLDVIGATMLMGGMALSGLMTPLVALGVLVAYLLVSAEVFLSTAVGGEFRMSFVRVGPTELRIAISALALALIQWPAVTLPGLGPVLLLDIVGMAAIAGLLTALGVSAVLMGRHLYVAEPRHR